MNKLAGIISKIHLKKAPLSWAALLISLIAQLFLLGKYLVASRYGTIVVDNEIALFSVLGGSTALIVAIFLSEKKLHFRILMLLRLASFLYLVRSMEEGATADTLLVLPVILEICIYESFYLNLILCAAIITVSVFIKSVFHLDFLTAMSRQINYIFSSLVFTATSGTLLYFREKCLNQVSRIDNLESAVAKLSTANLEYQHYATEAGSASMIEERKRITREIHDVIGYTLTNNIMMMEAAIDMMKHHPERVSNLIETARENAENGLEEIRDALHLLRAHEPPARPGVEVIARLAKVFEIATGIQVRLELGNIPMTLGEEIDGVLGHFVQEALTNSYRHGKATRVKVICWKAERIVYVSIWDNGQGSDNVIEGIGLKGMRERIENVSGLLKINDTNDGFRVSVEIPLQRARLDENVND